MRFDNEFTPESPDFSPLAERSRSQQKPKVAEASTAISNRRLSVAETSKAESNRWLSVAETSKAKCNRWLSVAEASSLTNKVHNLVVKLPFGLISVIINLSYLWQLFS